MQESSIPRKKRKGRGPQACEQCRASKVKCEHGDGKRCARCIAASKMCSGRSIPTQRNLELSKRVQVLEQKLHQMESVVLEKSSKQAHAQSSGSNVLMLNGKACATESSNDSVIDSEASRTQLDEAHGQLERMSITIFEDFPLGQSSDIVFFKEILDVRNSIPRRSRAYMPAPQKPSHFIPFGGLVPQATPKQYSFPDPDLLRDLINLYFDRMNVVCWVLHRPSFEKSVSDGLHFKDRSFAEVVLLVAATGSRWSDDPRALAEGSTDRLSNGWKWFSQVQLFPTMNTTSPNIYELQKYCFASAYMCGRDPHGAWSLVGIGLRLAQGMGVHFWRNFDPNRQWSIECELWKRVFWFLLCIDRFSSAGFGRPCFTHEEQFEVDLPTTLDEEYWGEADPKKAFKQGNGSPSKQECFHLIIRLSEILAFALRTIYSVGKFKAFLAKSNPHWREEVVQKLDSALNSWHASIPDHLRWPVNVTEPLFYQQSANLYLTYHSVQMVIHWPFLPSLIGRSSLSLSSLVICVNAARSCAHMFHAFTTLEGGSLPLVQPYYAPKAMTSGMILLLYIWEARKFGLSIDINRELENIRHCITYLKLIRTRFAMSIECRVDILERLLLQEESSMLSTLPHPPTRPAEEPPTADPKPSSQPPASSVRILPSSSSLDPQSTAHYVPQLVTDWGDIFRAFVDDSVIGSDPTSKWGLDGFTAAQGIGDLNGEATYGSLFDAFGAVAPPNLPFGL